MGDSPEKPEEGVETEDNSGKEVKPKKEEIKETILKCCRQKAFFDETNVECCLGYFKDCLLYRIGDQPYSIEKCENEHAQKYVSPKCGNKNVDNIEKKSENAAPKEKQFTSPCGLSPHSCTLVCPVKDCPIPKIAPSQCAQSCSPSHKDIDVLVTAAQREKCQAQKNDSNQCQNVQSQSSCAGGRACPMPNNKKNEFNNHRVDRYQDGVVKVESCVESPKYINSSESRQGAFLKCMPHNQTIPGQADSCMLQRETKHVFVPRKEIQYAQADSKSMSQNVPKCPLQGGPHCTLQDGSNCPLHNGPHCTLQDGPNCPLHNGPNCPLEFAQKCKPHEIKCMLKNGKNYLENFQSQNSPNCPLQNSPNCPLQNGPKFKLHEMKCMLQNGASHPANNGNKCILDDESSCIRHNVCENSFKEAFVVNNEFIIGKENVPMTHAYSPTICNNSREPTTVGKKVVTKAGGQACNGQCYELKKNISNSYPYKKTCDTKAFCCVRDVQGSKPNQNQYFKLIQTKPYEEVRSKSKAYYEHKPPYYNGPKKIKYSKHKSKSRYAPPTMKVVKPMYFSEGQNARKLKTYKLDPMKCCITNQSNSLQRHNDSTCCYSNSSEISQPCSHQCASMELHLHHYIPSECYESNSQQMNNCEIERTQCSPQRCSKPREKNIPGQCCELKTQNYDPNQYCESETKQYKTLQCYKFECKPMQGTVKSEIQNVEPVVKQCILQSLESDTKIYIECDHEECPAPTLQKVYVKSEQSDCSETMNDSHEQVQYYVPVQKCEHKLKECSQMQYRGSEIEDHEHGQRCEPNVKNCKQEQHPAQICKQYSEHQMQTCKFRSEMKEPQMKSCKKHSDHQLRNCVNTSPHTLKQCEAKDDPCVHDFKNEPRVKNDKRFAPEPEKCCLPPVKKSSESYSKCLCLGDNDRCPKPAILPHEYCHLKKEITEKTYGRSCKGFLRQKPRNSRLPYCNEFSELCKVPQFVCYHKPKLEKDEYSWRFTSLGCYYPPNSAPSTAPEKKVILTGEAEIKPDGNATPEAAKTPNGKEINDKALADKNKETGEQQKANLESSKSKTPGVNGKETSNIKDGANKKGPKKVPKKGARKGAKSKSASSVSTKSAKSKSSGKHAAQKPKKKK